MIEIGDIVAWDCPSTETTMYGIVVDTVSLGRRIIIVNFGGHMWNYFDEAKLRRIA